MDVPHPASVSWRVELSRLAGAVVGVAVHLLFAWTVWRMFWFLRDGAAPGRGGSLALDALLALQFAVPHSALLHPAVRKRLARVVAPAFYGLIYTAVSCGSLLLVFALWSPSDVVVWTVAGPMASVIAVGFYASWGALYYSLHLTGIGFQTGLTPWLAWLHGKPVPRREFAPRGAYRWLRHPVYLSFMGLIWFTPTMTLDHALLTGVWTAYLLFGSWLKDRRLERFIGAPYRDYESRVTGYPLALVGPLGKRRLAEPHAAAVRQAA